MGFFGKATDIISTGKNIEKGKNKLSAYDKAFNTIYDGMITYNDNVMQDSANKAEQGYKKDLGIENPADKEGMENSGGEGGSGGDGGADSGSSSMIAPMKSTPSKYEQMFAKNNLPVADILFKRENNITENEINNAQKFSRYESKDDSLNNLLNNKISSWYDKTYGNTPVQRDATGRQIDPTPKVRQAAAISAPMTRDGIEMSQGLSRLSQRMAEVDNDDTPDNGALALQKSLNSLGADPALKADGVIGPKTTLQTKRYLAENGYNNLDQAFLKKQYRQA